MKSNSYMKRTLSAMVAVMFAAAVYGVEYPDISLSDLKAAIAANQVTLLDANGTKKWQTGHIPGAINFEVSKDYLASILPKDKNVTHEDTAGVFPGDGAPRFYLSPGYLRVVARAFATLCHKIINTAFTVFVARVPVLDG